MEAGSQRADGDEPREEERDADLDSMGKDKRRSVVGKQYGATLKKKLLVYGIAVGIILVAIIGFFTIVKSLDEKEIPLEKTAPWAKADSDPGEPEELVPRDVDFMRNGPRQSGSSTSGDSTIPRKQIVNASR